ncbi:hypothetical protein NJT12_10575 [Flavobacterium sp. AC]|uniref:Peptidase C39-like domain-containing protein n=2 Tax=Flavobacteriaceae TaxID=49546 RepID=A0ABT4WC72_9FLAO|nr:hypothetical protein [Flavobacterium azizsancarii]
MEEGGNIIRNVFGRSYKEAESIIIHASEGDLNFISPKGINFYGKNGGKKFGNFVAREEVATTTNKIDKVKEIELLTVLDKGSKNDNNINSTTFQDGMVFGKAYHFKVKSYVQNPPANIADIKWMLKYHSPSQNKWLEIPLSVKGDSVIITMNDKDMCGRFIYLRAYIQDPESEGEYKQWKHNRFLWFDRTKVHKQIMDRIKDPWKINQGNSSLCGMAALYYAMAKKDASAYEKLAKELFRTGEYHIGSYVLKPHDKALSMYETNPSDRNYKAMKMPDIDWIVLATTRSKESLNSQFVYNGFENGDIDMMKGISWPEMLTRMCKEVAGFSSVEAIDLGLLEIAEKKGISAKLYDALGDIDIMHLKNIVRKYKQGHTILMMIDSSMIDDEPGYNLKDLTTDSHWVVYEGGLNFIDVGESKFVGFKIYTWGYDTVNQIDEFKKPSPSSKILIHAHQRIKIESFKSNYYGYIEVF